MDEACASGPMASFERKRKRRNQAYDRNPYRRCDCCESNPILLNAPLWLHYDDGNQPFRGTVQFSDLNGLRGVDHGKTASTAPSAGSHNSKRAVTLHISTTNDPKPS